VASVVDSAHPHGRFKAGTLGPTYLVTRRCAKGVFRLRPNHTTFQTFLFALACAAQKTGDLISAVLVMSNHVHLVMKAPGNLIPYFVLELPRKVAKVMNPPHDQRSYQRLTVTSS
jgi:REP element-mobilizing transposase RayT